MLTWWQYWLCKKKEYYVKKVKQYPVLFDKKLKGHREEDVLTRGFYYSQAKIIRRVGYNQRRI